MASIRKRGNSYLLVVSMGYDLAGRRRKARQKTVRPPVGLTPKQREKWLDEQATLFELECRELPEAVRRDMTLAAYTELWLRDIAPGKLAKSTLVREKQDIDLFLPYLGQYKLKELRPEHFRKLYAELRKTKNLNNGKPLSEATVEGVHACLCGILSDAMEGGFLDHNPAWRTYRYSGTRKEIRVADAETTQKIIAALEQESLKYETATYDHRKLTDEDFIFRRREAELPMTPTTFTYRFKQILKKNGLPENLNVHSLRHTTASLLIANGTDAATVAGLLGHSQVSTTLDIYTHSFDKNKKAASKTLQKGLAI